MHINWFYAWNVNSKMCLSVTCLIGLLIALQRLHFSNALKINAHSDPCIAKILSCDWYRQSFFLLNHKGMEMFTKSEDFQKACKHQYAYIRCMLRAEKFCQKTNLLLMAAKMIDNRRFTTEICRPTSFWQKLYLNEANCLDIYSRTAFLPCFQKIIEFTALNPNPTSAQICQYTKVMIDCYATELQEMCGYYAGIIMKKFLQFHSFTDYQCTDVRDDSIIPMPDYNIREPVSTSNSLSETTTINFDYELMTTTENYFSDSFDFDTESNDMRIESDEFLLFKLPDYKYKHKNRTTFALYENLKSGTFTYVGCGEADVYWFMLSSLKNKHCLLTDLKSKYSGTVFRCTIQIDASCSPELNDEEIGKNAVFHRRYVLTILKPPITRLPKYMAIINVHYLKFRPSPLAALEKKVNLWTPQNQVQIKQDESLNRKGSFESYDDNDILYQHSNGSGQDTETLQPSQYLDEDEYYEYQNYDYYTLDEEDDIYFQEPQANDIIYIEDDNGNLISLHDSKSPIYSKSLYQPHSLFRPRIGAVPQTTGPQLSDDNVIKRKKKSVRSSFFKQKKFESIDLVNQYNEKYCSAEAPCPPNSDVFKYGIRPDTYISIRNMKTFDPFKGSLKTPKKLQSSIKLSEGHDSKIYSDYNRFYVVTPSTKINVPKSTEPSYTEERYNTEFVTEDSINLPVEEIYDDIDFTVSS